MVNNDGKKTNEQAFWDKLAARYGEKARRDIPIFMSFYENEFDGVKAVCGCNPQAAETVGWLKNRGLRVALATNPIFPAVATLKRMRWAGFSERDFELYTTYENSSYCKPNPAYYLEVAKRLSVRPEECLMVGNDAEEDLAAREAGMDVFLLTDCLINRRGVDISRYAHGGFAQLKDYVGGV
jgi:FMN phosphatase YigB (HAD superfamily)